MANLKFYLPDQPYYKRKPGFLKTPKLSVHATGRFTFQGPAVEILDLKQGQCIQLGNDEAAPREWYLTKQPDLGFELFAIAGQPGLRFNSRPLRALLLSTLPFAPTSGPLLFKLDPMTVQLDDGTEAWPLLTAPYWQPQVSAEEKLSQKRTLTSAPPGLLGIKQRAQLYGT